MTSILKISAGQHSTAGRKSVNQDFHGLVIPREPLLATKGIAIALADGISSSAVSHIASESAVKGLLEDYYCTAEAWSVKTAVQRVLDATNSWLHAQTRRGQDPYDNDRGYVCTLSALVLKGTVAHLFHVGDCRIYRLAGRGLEQLTEDHRVAVGGGQSYLGRALGVNPQLEIDYRAMPLSCGDVFVLATDGVYEHVDPAFVAQAIRDHAADLDAAAAMVVQEALQRGSADNLTLQILRVDDLPAPGAADFAGPLGELPLPPLPEPRADFDGYRVIRELHGSSRSHIYLAADPDTGALVALKLPSIDLRGEPDYLRRFQLEEWVARRVNSAHVLKPCPPTRRRGWLYVATEYVDGRTLAQWMADNPKPDLETVRGIVEQVARGLQAFHRMEMLHQDLRPENIMIDRTGTAKIIDFGAVRVAGVAESAGPGDDAEMLGTLQYSAPEYLLGDGGSRSADIFSLGVIAYQMLTGRLPYGAAAARVRSRAALRRLAYLPAQDDEREIPAWIDAVLRKAVHPDPLRRYGEVSEFVHDLRQPNPALADRALPLIERNPLAFWKAVSATLALIVLALLLAFGLLHG